MDQGRSVIPAFVAGVWSSKIQDLTKESLSPLALDMPPARGGTGGRHRAIPEDRRSLHRLRRRDRGERR